MKDNNLTGRHYWRSLDQLAERPEFKEFLNREFPEGASELSNPITRRNFVALMGASLAFAGLAGCRRPVEKIIPYVAAPEEIIPGVASKYATSMPIGRHAYGLIVETHEGRPTKIEGNPDHPSTLGMSNVLIQASILGLYDPDRSKSVTFSDSNVDWQTFMEFWAIKHEEHSSNKGQGLAVLSESYSSPTLKRLEKEFRSIFPDAVWTVYDPISDMNKIAGIKLARSDSYQPVYHFEKARVILSLDCDFLQTESENITATFGFADGRRLESEADSMNRLYVVESRYSLTGAMADHRLKLKSGNIVNFVIALLYELKARGLIHTIPEEFNKYNSGDINRNWIEALADDLIENNGKSLVVAGRQQPPIVHAIIEYINEVLGATGNTIEIAGLDESNLANGNKCTELINKIERGEIDTLVILGANPVYNLPADLNFSDILKNVPNKIHLGLYHDETAKQADWHIPQSHYLESCSDASSVNNTDGVIQPLIEPLYTGKSEIEILNLIITGQFESGYRLVRDTWSDLNDSEWDKVLHDGMMPRFKKPVKIRKADLSEAVNYIKKFPLEKTIDDDIEITFSASPNVYDGRFANNGWLQELPDSMTKLIWDNAALISHSTASKYNLKNGDFIKLQKDKRILDIPIWLMPGQADNSISLTLGYGRENAGRVGDNVGFNCYKLRVSDSMYIESGFSIEKTGRKYNFASTQDHSSMEGRPIVREAALERYRENPLFAPAMVVHPPLKSLWEEHKYNEGNQWGMTIDLNVCTGCNACTIACQSENNIPVIGKEEAAKGREMHWIRLDRYFTGEPDDPRVVYQPVACQHCEMAPCEQVCPVAATVHDKEGLNTMVYNRCVGTRYCANNCPYKVRRFNFFNFTKNTPEVSKMAANPDVTVRSRGVMEKCTYCVQRLSEAKLKAKAENRAVGDGEAVTACQQACPARAIEFGNVIDYDSKVSKLKANSRNYGLLAEFNTRPRTSYLAKIRNPNPVLGKESGINENH